MVFDPTSSIKPWLFLHQRTMSHWPTGGGEVGRDQINCKTLSIGLKPEGADEFPGGPFKTLIARCPPPPRDSDSADLEWGPRVFISNQFPGEAAAASPPRAALKNHWLRANKCPIVEKHLPVYVLMTEELRHVPVSFFYRKADTSQSELRIEFSMV